MEGVFHFKSWFLNVPGLTPGGAYYQNFTVYRLLSVLSCSTPAAPSETAYLPLLSPVTGGSSPSPSENDTYNR